MNTQGPHTISNDLLAKYFAGEAAAPEQQAVELWVAGSPANQREFEQQKMLWEDLGAVMLDKALATRFDVDTAWSNVKAARQAGGGESTKASSPLAWTLRIAASLVLLAAVAYVLSTYLVDAPPVELAATTEILDIDLPDKSHVTLNQQSTIQYPTEFATNRREVSLKGEAFFEVEPDAERPFVIHAGAATITVLGTSFNVKSSVLEDTVSVFVATGRVLFAVGGDETVLTAGQKATYVAKSGLLASTSSSTSTGVDQFWKTRQLSFSGHSLPDVITALEAAYFVDIELENEQMANCRLSVNFENDPLDNILEVIALTLDLSVSKNGNLILLKGKGCPEN